MKLCTADNCYNPVFGGGYCRNHQYKRQDKKSVKTAYEKAVEQKKKSANNSKVRSLINTDQNKLVANQAAEDIDKMEKWVEQFAAIIEANPHCDECGTFIPKKYYRAASAHCLPKRKDYGFPSVKLHPDNRLVLGAGCGCHHKYDSTWEQAAQMKIFPKAIEIFLILYPHIAPSERKNIPDVLLQELQPK
jgi:hypothetical protein